MPSFRARNRALQVEADFQRRQRLCSCRPTTTGPTARSRTSAKIATPSTSISGAHPNSGTRQELLYGLGARVERRRASTRSFPAWCSIRCDRTRLSALRLPRGRHRPGERQTDADWPAASCCAPTTPASNCEPSVRLMWTPTDKQSCGPRSPTRCAPLRTPKKISIFRVISARHPTACRFSRDSTQIRISRPSN